MQTAPLLLRPSTPADLGARRDVYAPDVTRGTGTFELKAPDLAEMARCCDDVLSKGLPWLVAEHRGQVVAYAYAHHFRARSGARCWANSWRAARPPAHARCWQ